MADLQQKLDINDDEDYDDDDKKNKKTKTPAAANANQIDTTYYDYLINMSLRNFTKERREEILKDQKEKHDKLEALQKKSPEDLYEDDLLNFETEYRKVMAFSSIVLGNFLGSPIRIWNKNVSTKCPMLLIRLRRKQLVGIIKLVNDKRQNHNVLKRNQHHMVNVLHQFSIRL